MILRLRKHDWLFFVVCLGLGFLAERSFLHGIIGISYLIFIMCFYGVYFWRFRSFPFTNKKLGMMLIISIWLLAASYLLKSNMILYALNILVIPVLVLIQVVLVVYPSVNSWHKWPFLKKIFQTIGYSVVYIARFLFQGPWLAGKGFDEKTTAVLKRILIGLLISCPLLFVIINLLVSADQQFGQMVEVLPRWLSGIKIGDGVFRAAASLVYGFSIFGLLQVVRNKGKTEEQPAAEKERKVSLDSIVSLTVLVLLNIVYLLFVIVQFKYFFSETLQDGYTYAEFARRGFFELLFVALLNLMIISTVITFTVLGSRAIKLVIRGMLTLLVIFSGVMLYSAFIRLLMYEEAYGFTFTRVLAHAFMIFLVVILGYSLMKIWLERLSLLRFFIIASIVFYTLINTAQLESFVVAQNLERYKETGKIDIRYLNFFSYEGLEGLIELYKLNPEYPGLKELLQNRKNEARYEEAKWNSFNLSRRNAEQLLMKTDLE
jgi:hypothetical protein